MSMAQFKLGFKLIHVSKGAPVAKSFGNFCIETDNDTAVFRVTFQNDLTTEKL